MSNNDTEIQVELTEQRKKVDVDQFDITLREIVKMAERSELHRAPPYQRKFRWTDEKESRLIESLMLGLPVPSIFVATNADSTWEIVDGLQRVSTLIHFVADPPALLKTISRNAPLRLSGLTKLPTLNGKTFAELPIPVQLAFMKRSMRVTALSDKSDPDVRFDMFDRLNSGGVALTEHEIRSCIFSGKFIQFIERLSRNLKFNSLLKLPKGKKDDGTKEELVLKFFAYFHERNKFTNSVKRFLNDYTKEAIQAFDYKRNEKLFVDSVNTVAQFVQGPILRSGGKTTPLNEVEAILIGCADLIDSGKSIKKPDADWLDDQELLEYSQAGTNSKAMLTGRINRACALLGGAKSKKAAPKKNDKNT